jgi:hypothetical protein
VAGRLVTWEASALVPWREALRPAKGQLVEPLTTIFRDANQDTLSRQCEAGSELRERSIRPRELEFGDMRRQLPAPIANGLIYWS